MDSSRKVLLRGGVDFGSAPLFGQTRRVSSPWRKPSPFLVCRSWLRCRLAGAFQGCHAPVGPAALHAVLPIVLPSNICVNADSGNPQRVPVRRISVSKLCIPVTRISTMLVLTRVSLLARAQPAIDPGRDGWTTIVDICNQNVGHDHNEPPATPRRIGHSSSSFVLPSAPNARLNNRNESILYSPTGR